MKIFFLRLLFILSLVFFEFSFFDVLFPRMAAPVILIVSIVVWTLLVGFPRVLYMVIPLSAFFDIASSGSLGSLTLYAVLLSYATSFLSRRLLAEHHGTGMVLYALFASLGSFGYVVFNLLFGQENSFSWRADAFTEVFSAVATSKLLLPIFLSALLFPILHRVIWRVEAYMSVVAQREILQVK
ncbi:MAG: hypothetical protein A3J06_01115 [Candidatus Moranbacteria bacterium RIFCSPLOWO2_02_FULL_48_19]|nr:MAG: hypothetical protein A3J06_01115 [Candidatus Moranbacteria bacterium RIFCSPLOWO2_02_FULL_48_19]OGI30305.1 MAG: hypothetical protein A3G09_02220 [Candidatus Moranbacteria bacterium RIFCSPLOWO2_12_FULL_48_12]